MKPPKLSSILLFSAFLLILITCKNRESNNPFDTACPKEVFTPSDLNAEQQGAAVKLTWKQTNTNISGFVIKRNENEGAMAEVAKVDKTFLQWNDENIVADKKYGYQLFAYAGENLSNMLVAYCTPINKTVVVTDAVTGITSTSAVLGGNVTNDTGIAITERGVCYSNNVNPTTADIKVEMGSGSGAFSLTIIGLKAGNTYYARAYASTKQGTTYGTPITFTTSFLTITPSSYIVSKDGDSKVFTIASNIDWQVSSNQIWCTVSANNGKSNGSITITFSENKEVPQRTATITFTGTGISSQFVTLTQFGTEPPTLSITLANQNVTNIVGTTTVAITSNVAWTATIDQTWCKITTTSGTGNSTMTINYEANTTNFQRIATLSVTGLGLSAKTVTITQQSAIPTDGLVAYYPFNGNANDESGNGNNGTVNGATLTTNRKGITNNAFNFNNINNYISFPNPILKNSFTYSFWIDFNQLPNASPGFDWQMIFYKSDYLLGINNQKLLRLYLNGCQPGDFTLSWPDIQINTWYLINITYEPGLAKVFINGKLKGQTNLTGTFTHNTNSLILGKSNNGIWSYPVTGKIDDIRIYNRALTETEIQQLYNE